MVAKLARTCTLRIRPHALNFILADPAGGGVSMWCELPQVSRPSGLRLRLRLPPPA